MQETSLKLSSMKVKNFQPLGKRVKVKVLKAKTKKEKLYKNIKSLFKK
jgi:hypothetical protein